jgi:hypothetical protein
MYLPLLMKRRFEPDTINSREGHYAGLLGEMTVANCVGMPYPLFLEWKRHHIFDKADIQINGLDYDIKTKTTKVTPKPHHSCSVECEQHLENSGKVYGYIFSRTLKDCTSAFVVGFISYNDFERIAIKYDEGHEELRDDGTIYKYPTAAFDIVISKLIDPIKLLQEGLASHSVPENVPSTNIRKYDGWQCESCYHIYCGMSEHYWIELKQPLPDPCPNYRKRD